MFQTAMDIPEVDLRYEENLLSGIRVCRQNSEGDAECTGISIGS
jgi:hypothetical protein